jgi:hypothetical protein
MSNDLWIDEATDTIWRKGRDGKPEYVGTREQVKSQYAEIESPVRIGARALEAGAKRSISDLPGAVGDILSLGAANQPPPIGAGFVPGALDPYKRGAREPSVYPSQVLQSVLNIPEPKGEGERLLTEGVAGAGTGAIAGGLGALARGTDGGEPGGEYPRCGGCWWHGWGVGCASGGRCGEDWLDGAWWGKVWAAEKGPRDSLFDER